MDDYRRGLGRSALHAQPAAGMDHSRCRRSYWPGYRHVGWLAGIWRQWRRSFCSEVPLHQASQIDEAYKTLVLDKFQEKAQQMLAGMGPTDATQMQTQLAQIQAWMQSPEGHAGFWAFGFALNSLFLLVFAAAGGALGARWLARAGKPEV